jgi:hypothetical protein
MFLFFTDTEGYFLEQGGLALLPEFIVGKGYGKASQADASRRGRYLLRRSGGASNEEV